MFKKIIQGLCVLRNKLISRDDFAWGRYHKNYAKQLKRNEEDYTLKLSNDFEIVNSKLTFTCNPPLNNSHQLLYQVIHDLNPKSIFEVGCGCGDHLYNLQKIMPKINVSGCDLLQKQLDFLHDRHPELKDTTYVYDITKGPTSIFEELFYTQAVLMHIQKGNRHVDALRNLFCPSNKYIVLMENWTRHNFYTDIKNISKERFFPWKDLHIYKVDNGKQIIMVLSNGPIINKKLDYIKLESDEEMRKYLK